MKQGTGIVVCGDVSDIVTAFESDYFDGCFCDPPYGLGFMGKKWDTFKAGDSPMRRNAEMDAVNAGASRQGGRQRACVDYQKRQARDMRNYQEWCSSWAAAVLSTLRPGASLLAFGGTRTFHRLAVAIEDAGLEIRDTLCWLYGSGFPKSLDVSKAIDKAVGAEREVVGVSPNWRESKRGREVNGSMEVRGVNAGLLHGDAITPSAIRFTGYGTALKPAWEPIILAMAPLAGTFASNAVGHGVAGLNVDGCRIAAAQADRDDVAKRLDSPRSFQRVKPPSPAKGAERPVEYAMPTQGRWPANVVLDEEAGRMLDEQSGELKAGVAVRHRGVSGGVTSIVRSKPEGTPDMGYGGGGGASRFFYCAKSSKRERNSGGSNPHPTVKPLALCEYLARLILPPPRLDGQPRRLLVPFAGSGSEMIGALRAGWDEVIGIELEEQYAAIADKRIQAHLSSLQETARQ